MPAPNLPLFPVDVHAVGTTTRLAVAAPSAAVAIALAELSVRQSLGLPPSAAVIGTIQREA